MFGKEDKSLLLSLLMKEVSEEIGNPLTTINARIHCLHTSLGQNCAAKEHLAAITQQVRQIERLLIPLLNVCKICERADEDQEMEMPHSQN